MPNGGSDCCGTCLFNRKNRGQAGYSGVNNPEPNHCDIRDLPIENSFYTYCSNHNYHNPDRIRTPIGPVYQMNRDNHREVWREAPDTEEIRQAMLHLLTTAAANSGRRYHAGYSVTEVSIVQLGDWAETRAMVDLDRLRELANTVPPADDEREDILEPQRLAALATSALRKILPPDSILPFRTETVLALASGIRAGNHYDRLPILADALEEAGYSNPDALQQLRNNSSSPNWMVDVLTGQVR